MLIMWKIIIEPPEMKSDFDFFSSCGIVPLSNPGQLHGKCMAGDKLLQTQSCLKVNQLKS